MRRSCRTEIGGYVGEILRVDLSSRETRIEKIDERIAYNFLGGRGYGAWMLYNELDPKVDPLSEENKLIFMTGPLTGTDFPGAGRIAVCSKSPLTGTILDSSMGGSFGAYLKFAGFDGIILEGRSEGPVYILVEEGKSCIKDASRLWGKSTSQTEAELKELYPDSMIAEIGLAGENIVRIANIMSDTRAAGRGGLGAVMGSKKVKAIVVRGRRKVRISDEEAFKRLLRKIRLNIETHPATGKDGSLALHGTAMLIHIMANAGILPVDNFSEKRLSYEEVDPFSGETIKEKYLVGRKACYRCPTACGRRIRVAGRVTKGPEYESIAMFGPNSGFYDFENEIVPLCELCDEYGMDTISTGNIVGFARKIGLISSIEDAKRLVEDVAHNRSIFSIGLKRAAEELGKEDEAMHVKGLEMPGYNPAGVKGIALAYATSNRGACHLRAYTIAPEILNNPQFVDPAVEEGKAKLVKTIEDAYAVYDSLVTCKYHAFALFTSLEYEFDDVAKVLSAVTGWDYTSEILHEVGERIWYVERSFNEGAGVGADQDILPERLKVDLSRMLKEYYELRGGWIG